MNFLFVAYAFTLGLLSILSGSIATLSPSECANPPRDQCDFYADCVESRYHCGPSGYPIGYGQIYCEAFSTQRNELSSAGQTWILDTMQCLQRTLVPDATGAPGADSTCEELNDTAFASHPGCYIDNGFCTLPPTDWIVVLNIVHLDALFSSWEAVNATFGAAKGCATFYLFLLDHKELVKV